MNEATKRTAGMTLVLGNAHNDLVLSKVRASKVSLWISTANLKDVHVEARVGTRARAQGRYESLFEELLELAARGVEVRILHAGAPSRALAPKVTKSARLVLRQCPRVHMKMIAVDGAFLYLGSANFTGAGLGAKSEDRRNFEAGFATTDDVLLDATQSEFDAIWSGSRCKACKLRRECPRPIDLLVALQRGEEASEPEPRVSAARSPRAARRGKETASRSSRPRARRDPRP